jgi:ankyrin repeat protein
LAAKNGRLEVVRYLIEKGADIHAKHESALDWAVRNGELEVVKLLVEKGADIHSRDENALRWAAGEGQLEVVEFLLDKGCSIDLTKYRVGDDVKDFFKAYELKRMLHNKLQSSSPAITKTAKLKL